MSSHICLSTSNAPPPRVSSCCMERSVLRSTSRTCTGFRSDSVACLMKSWSSSIWWRSGQLSNMLVRRGSIFRRLRMKSWSFSRLCIAGDSSICCNMSGFCSTWRCSAPNWLGIWLMSMPLGPSPPAVWLWSRCMVLVRSTPYASRERPSCMRRPANTRRCWCRLMPDFGARMDRNSSTRVLRSTSRCTRLPSGSFTVTKATGILCTGRGGRPGQTHKRRAAMKA
mmetsp:Transcript_107097/g.302760  ORF Transcript_107097/g.302760 Transcript_107097/m.302760 type:complete len:225 (-) Transcript_107097:8-682(-)